MTIKRMPLPDGPNEEWRELRRKHVTASILGALPAFHCHDYRTPLRIYMEKRGLEIPERETKVMRSGRIFESSVSKAVAEERPEWHLEQVGAYYFDEDTRTGATPDYFIFGDPRGRGVLQAKTVDREKYEVDWLNGTLAPRWIELQVRLETMMTGAHFGAIAALTIERYDPKLGLIDVPRDAAAEEEIKEAIRSFWHDVEVGNEPDPIFGDDSEIIKRLTDKESAGAVLDARGHNDLPELLAQRAALKARMRKDDERCVEIDDEIRFRMGTAEKIVGLKGWSVTYRTRHVAGYTVEPRTGRQLDIRDHRPPEERPT